MEFWQRQFIAIEGYLELGMFAEASSLLDELPPADQERVEASGLRCQLFLQSKQWDRAAEIAAELTQSHPQEAQHWISLAFAMRRNHSIERAQEILLIALGLHPEEWCIHYNLACYAAVQGDLILAEARLSAAFKLQPECRQMAKEDPDLISMREIE